MIHTQIFWRAIVYKFMSIESGFTSVFMQNEFSQNSKICQKKSSNLGTLFWVKNKYKNESFTLIWYWILQISALQA